MGKYCYVASAPRHARRLGAHGERRGAGTYCVATRTACCIRSVEWIVSRFVGGDDVCQMMMLMLCERLLVVSSGRHSVLIGCGVSSCCDWMSLGSS